MALVKCPECEKEISDTVKKCPNCGYKIKKKVSKKKKIIIIVIILILIIAIVGTAVGFNMYNKKKISEYDNLIVTTDGKTYIYGLIAETYCYDISQVWYNAIFKKTFMSDSFNVAINNYLTLNSDKMTRLKEEKNELGEDMKKLKNVPNQDYQDIYDETVNFYGIFSNLVDMATSPSGSYDEYTKTYNEYVQEFKNSYNKIEVLKPEVANYKENQ